jgi:hypothetical protein
MVKERSPLFHIICLVVDVVHVVGLNNAPYLCLCYVVALLLMDNIFLYMELWNWFTKNNIKLSYSMIFEFDIQICSILDMHIVFDEVCKILF